MNEQIECEEIYTTDRAEAFDAPIICAHCESAIDEGEALLEMNGEHFHDSCADEEIRFRSIESEMDANTQP